MPRDSTFLFAVRRGEFIVSERFESVRSEFFLFEFKRSFLWISQFTFAKLATGDSCLFEDFFLNRFRLGLLGQIVLCLLCSFNWRLGFTAAQ